MASCYDIYANICGNFVAKHDILIQKQFSITAEAKLESFFPFHFKKKSFMIQACLAKRNVFTRSVKANIKKSTFVSVIKGESAGIVRSKDLQVRKSNKKE